MADMFERVVRYEIAFFSAVLSGEDWPVPTD
jgi:hypothetical protein